MSEIPSLVSNDNRHPPTIATTCTNIPRDVYLLLLPVPSPLPSISSHLHSNIPQQVDKLGGLRREEDRREQGHDLLQVVLPVSTERSRGSLAATHSAHR